MARTATMEKRPAEASKTFIKTITDWQAVEDDTIR